MSNNFKTYLKNIKNDLSYDKPMTVVVGNEAADLDSMATAVLYAYYLKSLDGAVNSVPLINIPRADFKLRTEAVYLFDAAGIDSDELIFAEDLDLKRLNDKDLLSLILVDHNKLSTAHSEFLNCITGILDHHADEKQYPEGIFTDIRPVGSASTLVGELFIKNAEETVSGPVGTLILGTILLDTVNLDPDAGRVTDADSAVAEKIMAITGLDRKELFDKLQFEKFNVSSLGSYDLLRKDYKEWQMGSVKCGIGSVLLPVEDWIAKDPGIVSACEKYLKERELDVLFAMNAFTNPEFTRQIVVYIPDEDLRRKTIDFLEASDLGLSEIDSTSVEGSEKCAFYNQANLGISRKKLQPIIKDFFEK
ncbi:DHH family phosphoesterase [Spirochaeta isovalerica]|uniref:Exopolyphosphatase n=1 Tax=Spirochaeta isovalerica TaxID=150 RepID=A0A841RGN4_9SPIO|nr:DHHA2 domain-containing protein [Spirochaeta isovalerica]MBB6482180.1 exopolyphosphatase [Spirochaeta isovalerica]